MSDRDAFLRTICETPEDDTPRLVFADWPEERGEAERAEFIRLQCAMARLSPDTPEWRELRKRERAFILGPVQAWREELPQYPGMGWGNFRRGFVEELTL